ncbi:MAG: hypothetical protein AB7K41_02685, partial [Bdellovibrionales bacterium]
AQAQVGSVHERLVPNARVTTVSFETQADGNVAFSGAFVTMAGGDRCYMNKEVLGIERARPVNDELGRNGYVPRSFDSAELAKIMNAFYHENRAALTLLAAITRTQDNSFVLNLNQALAQSDGDMQNKVIALRSALIDACTAADKQQ